MEKETDRTALSSSVHQSERKKGVRSISHREKKLLPHKASSSSFSFQWFLHLIKGDEKDEKRRTADKCM